MNSKSLIIPSAKYISKDLQCVGEIPPVIYPVLNGQVLDYIIASYEGDIDTRVVLYEGANIVKSRCKLYKSNVHLHTLKKLKGLKDTVLYALEKLKDKKCPTDTVVINFGDTITNGKALKDDSFLFSYSHFSPQWTFFDDNGGELSVYDRPQAKSEIGKIFIGAFQFSDFPHLYECFSEGEDFYDAIVRYHSYHPLTPIFTEEWYDIGHLDRYIESKRKIQERSFNHISIDKNRGILTKTSHDKQKFINEIKWYLKLPSDIEYCRPRIFSYSLSFNEPKVSMEYYAYHTVHELFLYGSLNMTQWYDIISQIHFICKDMSRYTVKDDGIKASLEDIYLKKTTRRLNNLTEQPYFAKFKDSTITVNGNEYPSLSEIVSILTRCVPSILYDTDSFQIIHGDLCFTNILIDDNHTIIKLIDPRGNFGNYDIYGDGRYDIAKLYHSIEGGYDLIIKNQFELDYDASTCKIDYNLLRPEMNFNLVDVIDNVFEDVVKGHEKEIKLIESLLFLSMIPLHNEDVRHQMVMLGTGLELLSKTINLKEVD